MTQCKKYHTNYYQLHGCITVHKNIILFNTHIIEIYFTLQKISLDKDDRVIPKIC